MPDEKQIPHSWVSSDNPFKYNQWCTENFGKDISNDYTIIENNKQKGNSFVSKLTKKQLDANQNNNVQAAA